MILKSSPQLDIANQQLPLLFVLFIFFFFYFICPTAYQEQTFRKPTVDDNYDTCSEPLLPVVDENTKLTLERQQLIIDRDSVVLGEIIGQGW